MRFLLLFLSLAAGAHAADATVKLVVGSASAKPKTALVAGSQFTTGSKSHSELTMTNGIVRTGSATAVRITGPDAVALEKGLAVVASAPRAFFRKSLTVTAPKHNLKVRGTAQVYHDPGHSIRVVVLEGQVSLALDSLSHENVTLRAGQELIINPVETRLPKPIEVDLTRLMATAQLLSTHFEPLQTTHIITECSHQQTNDVGHDDLESSGIVMTDASGELYLEPQEIVHKEAEQDIGDLDGDGKPDPDPLTDSGDGTDPNAADSTAATDNQDNTDNTTNDNTDTPQAAKRKAAPGKRKAGASGPIILNKSNISQNAVTIGNTRTRANIQITNSSQVAALAGQLQVLAHGGSIAVDSSSLSSSSALTLDTSSSAPGLVTISNANLSAQVITARAFGSSGTSLIIDGSTLTASQLIQLYAEGASDLVFRNHVVLNTPVAKLAGKNVRVDPAGSVDISGRAEVYTDNAQFNNAGHGTLNANGGVTLHSYSSKR